MELPVTDRELIHRCQAEYQAAQTSGANTNSEGLRLVWMAEAMMDRPGADETFARELVYLRAVGKYRLGKLLEARRQLDELLKVAPESHQAQALKQAVEDQIVKEGLIGVGIVGGALGVGAVLLGALLSRR